MVNFIKVQPKCEYCGGSLELSEVIVDLLNCNYTLFLYCLMCGEEHIEILQLTDFIEISQILGGRNE